MERVHRLSIFERFLLKQSQYWIFMNKPFVKIHYDSERDDSQHGLMASQTEKFTYVPFPGEDTRLKTQTASLRAQMDELSL